MNDEIKKLIERYGITDPKLFEEKYRKNNARFDDVIRRQLLELEEKISSRDRLKRAEKILKNKKNK